MGGGHGEVRAIPAARRSPRAAGLCPRARRPSMLAMRVSRRWIGLWLLALGASHAWLATRPEPPAPDRSVAGPGRVARPGAAVTSPPSTRIRRSSWLPRVSRYAPETSVTWNTYQPSGSPGPAEFPNAPGPPARKTARFEWKTFSTS